MLGSITADGMVSARPLFLMVVGIQVILLTGCGASFSGKSEAVQFAERRAHLGDAIVAAGGTAKVEEQSMEGFTMKGWTINLSGAKITDTLVDKLIEMGNANPILDLNLSRSAITDVQLGKLDKGRVFGRVVNLDLSDTKVTDGGLDQINAVVALTNLNLKGTSATKEGAERLGKRKIENSSTPKALKKQPKVTI